MFNARTGNFARAGKSAADETVKAFAASRRNSVDFGKMAQDAQKMRSKEKIATIKAEQEVALAGIRAQSDVRKNKIEVKAASELKSAKRKAGVLAAAGEMISKGGTLLGESKDIKLRDTSDSAYDTSGIEAAEADLAEATANVETFNTGINPETGKPYAGPGTADTESPTIPPAEDLTDGATSQKAAPISSFQATGTKGKYGKQQLEQLLTSNGMSPENARILSAIGIGESGGNATIDTVQSGLDPNKRNEFSVGLFQINTQAHQDKLDRRGWTADDLRDPNKNAQIAIEVFNEAGSFKPWSVYTSGAYKQYL